MCYENEFCIDQWHHVDDHKEEFGTTSFKEFDGTEREDEKHVPDLDEFNDTADHDFFVSENRKDVIAVAKEAIQQAKEQGNDPVAAAKLAIDDVDLCHMADGEIDEIIETLLNPTVQTWTIGFRLNGEPKIHTHETTAKDGISAWQSIKDFYESGGDRISWVYTY